MCRNRICPRLCKEYGLTANVPVVDKPIKVLRLWTMTVVDLCGIIKLCVFR